MNASWKSLAAVALFSSFTACDCVGRKVDVQNNGEIGVIVETDGVRITSPEGGTYDFGQVSMGTSKQLLLRVVNNGRGPFTISTITKASGDDAVKIGERDEPAPVFEVAFSDRTVVAIGQTIELPIDFHAPPNADPTVKSTDHLAVLTLALEAATTESATITLKGTAISGSCDVPRTLDFGAVSTGDSARQQILLQNLSPIATTGFAGELTSSSGDHQNFDYAPESARGNFPIAAGKSQQLSWNFKPTEVRDYLALVKVRAADACPEVTVTLLGSGVDSVLSYDNPLQFGYVAPGTEVTKDLTFRNLGVAPVQLSRLAITQQGAQYGLPALTTLTVPGGTRTVVNGTSQITPGTATLAVSFRPNQLGLREGTLGFASSLLKQPTGTVTLRGYGGGPDIDVKPNPVLNFGKVAFFDPIAGNPPYAVNRKLTIRNLGTAPAMPSMVEANLHLGQLLQAPYANGTTQKFWEWHAKPGTGALDSELCVGGFDPATGCVGDSTLNNQTGLTAGGFLDVPVRLTPASDAPGKEWELVIYSNDADEAVTTITIRADVVRLPPCRATIVPTMMNFGLVTPPTSRDQAFVIRNDGVQAGEICLVSSVVMKPGSDPVFSLPNGEVEMKELQPGESLRVPVRVWPQGAANTAVANVTGFVTFGLSDPVMPQREVALQAAIANSCLTIAPAELNFGTVQQNCSSQRRDFTVYNTCAQPVTVNSFGMIAGAGQPAGGPNCPGTSPCPEFVVDGTPGFSPGTVIPANAAMPYTFALKYKPIDLGIDSGAYLIKVTQNGQQVDYVVPLTGTGDTMGLNVDTFRQDNEPKADILLVVDDSCSMADKQAALASNFGAFMTYALQLGVKFQLGVATTTIGTVDTGKLVGDANNPRILTNTTPNLAALFAQKVAVGTGGGTEGVAEVAVAALTAPLIVTDNAGFLRPEAVLAVVAVTDAGDQSPLAATVYENQLRNIKGAQRPNMFTYNVVGPFNQPTGSCAYDDYTDVTKHVYLTTRFNGIREEICSANWARALEEIGKNAFGFRTNFFLTAPPANGTVAVAIDGVAVPETDMRGATVWSYDGITNSVNFEPLFTPELGRVLTVTYTVACNGS